MCHGCFLNQKQNRFMPGLVSTGFKRKHDALEEDEGKGCPAPQAYTMQRQSVLNISICKLKTTRALIEPSLRRSVLICNTLRQIEQELRAEGRYFDSTHLSMIIGNQYVEENTDKEISPATPTPNEGSANSGVPNMLTCHRTSEVCAPIECLRKGELSASQTTDSLSRSVCGCSGCLAANNNRLSSATATISLMSNHQLTSKVHSLGSAEDATYKLPSKQNNSSSFNGLFNTSDILDADESFSDIDINIYDFDPNSSVMLNPKPTSTADDWLKALMGDLTTTLNSSSNNDSSNQASNCRSDLVDELDQIMHVLVDVGM
ncbi:LOW QUALITY PROTEIN: uncharacterized protein [Amphiura filiformis]|uniref:LOW QUALITY PROTEIN: uncharacterized protein n=1 Tax=Amphiura filiformis TaxID=82378 RepID=UPI003B2117C8